MDYKIQNSYKLFIILYQQIINSPYRTEEKNSVRKNQIIFCQNKNSVLDFTKVMCKFCNTKYLKLNNFFPFLSLSLFFFLIELQNFWNFSNEFTFCKTLKLCKTLQNNIPESSSYYSAVQDLQIVDHLVPVDDQFSVQQQKLMKK